MFPTLRTLTSRTTYRGSRGSGSGASSKSTARSSPFSKPTAVRAQLEGRTFKASQRGLYHGAVLQSGHNVPNSRQKTARTWRPNVQKKNALWSNVLQMGIECKTTVRALRTMKKHGGLDGYIQTTDSARLGAFGRDLRDKMALAVRRDAQVEHTRVRKQLAGQAWQRKQQGLPPLDPSTLLTTKLNHKTSALAKQALLSPLQQAFETATAASQSTFAPVKPGSALALLAQTPEARRAAAARSRKANKSSERLSGVAELERRTIEARQLRRAAWQATKASQDVVQTETSVPAA